MEKKAFELRGRVEAVLVTAPNGPVTSGTYGTGSLTTVSVPKIQLVRGHGIKGDRHAGTRLADVREKEFLSFGFSKGTEIMNLREFSAVSVEELVDIAVGMTLPSSVPLGSLGENIIISGIPKFTELPTGTMFFFQKEERQKRTAVLLVWGENMPCEGPGEAIQAAFPNTPNLAKLFPKAAIGKRGVVGSIFASGMIHAGDEVIVKVPKQRIYDPK